MFVTYNNLDEFLAACRAPVFVSNNVVYLAGREKGQLQARSTIVLTTVLEASPEVIGVVSLTVEAPPFDAKFAEAVKPHFLNRSSSARNLVEEYIRFRRADLRCCRGLLANGGLTEALEKIVPAQQNVFELVTSSKGRAIRPLAWKQNLARQAKDARAFGENSSLLDQIIADSMLVKETVH